MMTHAHKRFFLRLLEVDTRCVAYLFTSHSWKSGRFEASRSYVQLGFVNSEVVAEDHITGQSRDARDTVQMLFWHQLLWLPWHPVQLRYLDLCLRCPSLNIFLLFSETLFNLYRSLQVHQSVTYSKHQGPGKA